MAYIKGSGRAIRNSWILSTIFFISFGMGICVMAFGLNKAYYRGYSNGYLDGFLVLEMGGEEAVEAWAEVARRCTPILDAGETCTIPYDPALYP